MSEAKSQAFGREIDLEAAYLQARRLLTHGRGGLVTGGDFDSWRLARAQWHYDYGNRAYAERELADLNGYRAARDHEQPGSYPPRDLRRS